MQLGTTQVATPSKNIYGVMPSGHTFVEELHMMSQQPLFNTLLRKKNSIDSKTIYILQVSATVQTLSYLNSKVPL